jgi:hypothetical protein
MTTQKACFNASIRHAYSPKVFAALPDFRQAKESLSVHRDKIKLLGDVICRHELHDVFGVNLLHQHFELYEDEHMVKRRDRDLNQAYIQPEKIQKESVGYFWKPSIVRGSFVYQPTEFFTVEDQPDGLADMSEIYGKAPEFFTDFANVLYELELHNVFGLALLHEAYLDLEEDHVKLETTDDIQRRLWADVVHRRELDLSETTQTLWTFTHPDCTPSVGSVASGAKPTFCTGHCKAHCANHCANHK